MKPKLHTYNALTQGLKSELPYDDERALVDFRAFYALGQIHTRRVRNKQVIAVFEEILENLKNNLQDRKDVLS